MFELLPLRYLPVGRSGRIGHLAGPDESVHRLQEIGLRLGVEVEMLQAGDPCIVRIGGQRLCVRHEEHVAVLVQPQFSMSVPEPLLAATADG